jgi:hypothetical protein
MKSGSKTSSQGFKRNSNDLDNSYKTPHYVSEHHNVGSPNYSKTIDLGSIKYQPLGHSSSHHNEEEEIKQRLNYLEVIEQSIKQFESTRSTADLRQLN